MTSCAVDDRVTATSSAVTVREPKTNAARTLRAAKDVIMRPTTTTALALAGTALALPAGVALAASRRPAQAHRAALAAPFAGHLR